MSYGTNQPISLSALADEVNRCFANTDEFRISAGRKLIEARHRLESGEAGQVTWSQWIARNIQRSARDVRKVMAIASSPDPMAALSAERTKARVRMAQARAQSQSGTRRSNVRPPEPANDEERFRSAVEQALALRETLAAIKDHRKRARALELVDKRLADVREELAKQRQRGEL